MKKEKLSYATITVAEVWQPSVLLRWVEKAVTINKNTATMKMVLQQLHTSNLGIREWKDVPIETES
jgi:hypothetical protein